NEPEPGTYYLGTDGNVYFVPQFGLVGTLTWSSVIDAPGFAIGDGQVTGSGGGDVIDAGYADPHDGDQITTGADAIRAGAGDDSVLAGGGNDTVYGGTGDDTLLGQAGNDVLHGDTATPATGNAERVDWTAQGIDGSNIAAGFGQITGQMDVSVAFAGTGNNAPTYAVENGDSQ
ncbi:unnamed protein product, partial [Laminaria digitata]